MEKNVLSPVKIHQLAEPLSDPRKFRSFNYLEQQLWYKLLQPFNVLRRSIPDSAVLQTIPKAALRETYFTELEALETSIRENAQKPWYADETNY